MVIPEKIRRKLAAHPRMEKCCYKSCGNPNVEWHHALIVGKAIQEEYAIFPLCCRHHRGEFGTISAEVKQYCEWLAIKKGLEELEKDYPKQNWAQRLKYLDSKYERKN